MIPLRDIPNILMKEGVRPCRKIVHANKLACRAAAGAAGKVFVKYNDAELSDMTLEASQEPGELFAWVIASNRERSRSTILVELARYREEMPKLQKRLSEMRSEVRKLRGENAELKQHCERLQKEAKVNSRMIDEVIGRRVGECFAMEGARAIEAVLRLRSGVDNLAQLRKQMKLSCVDAIGLFSRLGRADLVKVAQESVELTPVGVKVAERFAEAI